MGSWFWGMLIAVLSGAMMSVQGVWNAGLTKETNIWLSSGFVQLTAFGVCLLGWMLTGSPGSWGDLFRVPEKWMLLGGVLGAFITYTVIQAMNRLGPAQAVMLIVTAQLLVAYLIELLGWFQVERQPFSWQRLLGMGLAILGIVIFKK